VVGERSDEEDEEIVERAQRLEQRPGHAIVGEVHAERARLALGRDRGLATHDGLETRQEHPLDPARRGHAITQERLLALERVVGGRWSSMRPASSAAGEIFGRAFATAYLTIMGNVHR
jgi:hypothetical protein